MSRLHWFCVMAIAAAAGCAPNSEDNPAFGKVALYRQRHPSAKTHGTLVRRKLALTMIHNVAFVGNDYDIRFGTYGHVTGTFDSALQPKFSVPLTDDASMAGIVKAMLADSHGVDVTVTGSTATLTIGRKSHGKYPARIKITFTGSITSGDGAGDATHGTISVAAKVGGS